MSALTSESLLAAYSQGAFPMADPESGKVEFFACDPRFLLPLDDRFHVPKSLKRVVRSGRFEVRRDTAFAEVVSQCARDRTSDNRNWISPAMVQAYVKLHGEGFAHSVEAWSEGRLVGGLYGVSIGRAFFGESMFSRPDQGGTDASKVALVHLVSDLRQRDFALLDSQYDNGHLARFGGYEVSEIEYRQMLERALAG
ncbi:MAG: leucyl/phenylalanyl-tRNA--protein transferase [Phycisphaerales bacterium]|nr:leucyl/phenylalanyl-tRNA--protein transferase [Phycisphaerales bacterium]